MQNRVRVGMMHVIPLESTISLRIFYKQITYLNVSTNVETTTKNQCGVDSGL